MSKELDKMINQIWNEKTKEILEVKLSDLLKKEIKLPDGEDYLKIFAETHKTDEQIYEEKIEKLQQKIDKAIEYIKENKYVSADENCEIIAGWRIDELLEILGGNNEN